jgi:hypothetical protein
VTREEAIKRLEDTFEGWERWNPHNDSPASKLSEALEMAISALREQDVTDINVGNKTNADHIRSMTDEELAAHNVQDSLEYTVDYDWDERPIGEYTPCFKTSDGATFWSYEDAVEYELHWLKRPYKEATDD